MKTDIFKVAIMVVLTLSSCNGKWPNSLSRKNHGKITKAQVTRVVEDYFMHKFKNPVKGENEGLVRIQGDQEICLFKQDKIFIGKLDEDDTDDAIVTVGYQKTGSQAYDRHLILTNRDSLKVVRDFALPIDIQLISKRTVITTMDTSPREMNAGKCPSCRFLVDFKLQGDSLVRIR
jgi:hypothetical protein